MIVAIGSNHTGGVWFLSSLFGEEPLEGYVQCISWNFAFALKSLGRTQTEEKRNRKACELAGHIRSYEPKVAQVSRENMVAISKIWGMKKTKSPLWKTVITKSSFHLSRRGCKMIRKNSFLHEMPHTCGLRFTKEGTVWPRHDTVSGCEASQGVFGREAAEQDEGLF